MDRPRIHILVVDDEPQIREVLEEFLRGKGHVVYAAASAEEALENEDLKKIEVGLIDIHLPGKLTGHDLIERLNSLLPEAAMIMMSGQGKIDDLITAFERHVFTFISKPFESLNEIELLVRRAAEAKRNEIAAKEYTRSLETSKTRLEEEVAKRTQQLERMRNIVSHLFAVSSKLGLIEPLDSLLNYVCQSIVDAGAFRRAVILLCDDKFIVRHIGVAEFDGVNDLIQKRVRERRDAPLRPYDFAREEQRIGTGYYAKATSSPVSEKAKADGWQFGDQLTVPLRRQDGAIFGYLSVDEPLDNSRPSEEIIQYLDVLLNHSALHVEAQQFRQHLRDRASELEQRVQERTTELRQSQEKFSRLVNLTSDIVYVTDAEGKIIYLNDAFMTNLGYVRENYIGNSLAAVLQELVTDDPSNRVEIENLTSESDSAVLHRIELLTRQGDKRVFEINRSVIRQGGEFQGTQGIARDVTEHRALLKRVMSSERLAATGRLAAGVAHEINNPLQAITSQLNAVLKQTQDNKEAKEHLEQIGEGIDRIRTIVRGMLDLHRTQSSATVDVNLNEVIEKVLALTAKQLRGDNVEVVKELSDIPPVIKGSPSDLQQVILNLILNASEAMPEGGILTVSSDCVNDAIDLKFKDTGTGIPAELQKKIFDPFFSNRVSGGGVGLGLYLSRNIVEIHQGTIKVDSEMGKGTIFTLSFPIL
ncbi:response regulator [bacterium]|nr:response regulator [bacterium]MBU1636223.1 response regulator [bacterium]MBU1921571.1 response regulator [bacterium]